MNAFLTTGMLSLILTGTPGADTIVRIAGPGTGGDGSPALTAKLVVPFGLEFSPSGERILIEFDGQRVRKIDAQGNIVTIAGSGKKGSKGDGGPAADAEFNGMHNLAIGKDGTIYVCDTWNYRVRAIDPKSGMIRTVAGTGTKGDGADSADATKTPIGGIYCVSCDGDKSKLILTDLDFRKIRSLDLATGKLTTVAGNGKKGVPTDGSVAVESPLVDPRAAVTDRHGNLIILERGGNALRLVDVSGKIRTVAGTGKTGLTGDGGPASQATMNGPKHLCIDHDGESVLIADAENHVIRRWVAKTGMIERVAGTGKKGTAGLDGPPDSAQLNRPHGVTRGPNGSIVIVDSYNNRILQILPGK
ncbi:NHL repeat-containing protein [Tuwongella immobilis]|uniref:SMP-30/Gluconolactonase/LRE-like region domain-containing protein n=1 Tax=Tuwongella immobilis TaxID=692036 RepID=A0A6C2YNG7_9BACT|nr:hypothetical protein [Tuwongella immobilis]VIP02917.1 nhl repeat containing protein : NHL repeat protein OS=Singulisphaera acidiphila (strain ATCC BAA-1392 / DSM 18658 / VKM B-2454 / MOB10) GN=Sinac_0380 PE=4 SV=1: NHL [Tuwongella immobilis]VTS02839.1 nhl repeat containing protein : NHL repeat protein OS=Singulisphaera acidiphila (strain ATCC BAA-1392 / DSM 18658 / VKM B-2454 / MOB10) GN=Sinac_0380 PE=4 SV=1: NHL [Tuwongella immobilis]